MTDFSVLEQAPIRAGVPQGQSLRDTIAFAREMDRLGYRRLWVAEHHAIGAVASSAPEVILGQLAASTRKLRIGSGGMLLPNHRPLHVAEQFRALEALHPGRIDLGIGRSEGSLDEATVLALDRSADNSHGGGYEAQLDELLSFGGVRTLPADHPLAGVRAMPADVPLPPVFLLGSSAGSAANAARRGLGYGFAAYTSPDAFVPALRLYRERFEPAGEHGEPHAILGLKVVVGSDEAHARELALPWHLALVRSRMREPAPLMRAEEARRHRWTEAERKAEKEVDVRADVIGSPAQVRERIEELVAESGADEVIVTTNTHDPAERIASYTRLAEVFGLSGAASSAAAGAAVVGLLARHRTRAREQ